MDPIFDPAALDGRKRQLYDSAPVHPAGDLAAWHSTVVFAPHPDDESLGCGGLIGLLVDRGQTVRVVFLTDGSASHPASRKYGPDERRKLRESEALAACRVLGVAAEDVHFLRMPDGALPSEFQDEFEPAVRTVSELLRPWQADTWIVPWRRDPHEDHRATWDICRACLRGREDTVRWIEYPIWMWEARHDVELPRPGEMIVWSLDIGSRLGQKEKAIRAHRSQWAGTIDDDPTGFQLPEPMIDHFIRPREIFFEPADKRDRSLGETYFDAVYRDSGDPWAFETSSYEREKYAATIRALPQAHYTDAFEIGCSIGVLTERLADRCDRLLAVDLNEAALASARRRLEGRPAVTFRKMAVPQEFPTETFGLILLSEVGYYWSYEDLHTAIDKIQHALRPGGTLMLVHYTPYVPDYPLTGDEVHEVFSERLSGFDRISGQRADRYRMDVWKKRGESAPSA